MISPGAVSAIQHSQSLNRREEIHSRISSSVWTGAGMYPAAACLERNQASATPSASLRSAARVTNAAMVEAYLRGQGGFPSSKSELALGPGAVGARSWCRVATLQRSLGDDRTSSVDGYQSERSRRRCIRHSPTSETVSSAAPPPARTHGGTP